MLNSNETVFDVIAEKQRREIEMLQAAFESYKLQLMDEMNEKLNRRLNDVRQELLDDAQDQLQEMRKNNAEFSLPHMEQL